MTPPPLSRQIKQLEIQLGGRLFVRGYHHVELTALGEALVVPVRQALAQVEAIADIAGAMSVARAPLRLGATPYAPTPYLDEFLDTMRNGGLSVDEEIWLEYGSHELAKRVGQGALDLALIHMPSPDASLASMSLREYRLAVAVRGDDVLAGRESVTLEDLRGRRVVHPLGKLHPLITEEQRAVFAEFGIDAMLEAAGPIGAAESATQVWSRHLAALVPDVRGSILGRVFSAPEFTTIPITGRGITMQLGVIWSPRPSAQSPGLMQALTRIRDVVV